MRELDNSDAVVTEMVAEATAATVASGQVVGGGGINWSRRG